MSYSNLKRTRTGRNPLGLPPGFWARAWQVVRRQDVLWRLSACLVAALTMWLLTRGWAPPFAFRTGYVPPRDVIARVDFSVVDEQETLQARAQAKALVECVYDNDPGPLAELREELKNKVGQLAALSALTSVDPDLWKEFAPTGSTQGGDDGDLDQRKFDAIKAFFSAGMDSGRFDEAMKLALAPLETRGVIDILQHTAKEGSQQFVQVRSVAPAASAASAVAAPKTQERVSVDDVLFSKVKSPLEQRIAEQIRAFGGQNENSVLFAGLVFQWLERRLQTVKTLKWDQPATRERAEAEAAAVPNVVREFKANDAHLAASGKPLDEPTLLLLRHEYNAWRAEMPWTRRISHTIANLGMYGAIYTLCGFYIFHRKPKLLSDWRSFCTLLGSFVITVVGCWAAAADQWRAEIIPLLLFGMTAAIAYEKELALLLAASAALAAAFSLDQGLAEFVIMVSPVAASIVVLRRIRSRTKLIYVGAFAGLVVLATTLGVGTLIGQSFAASDALGPFAADWLPGASTGGTFFPSLLAGGAWYGLCAITSGLLMTGLLPTIEKVFDVQTDISLLELGDVQHPLLQQLVRKAPGTYNHSINVASIAENAAEAIGANGLLVRVGAYFHDIGKMLKPSYFVENQGAEGNRHESLQPAMSTLVIIAHVKDGADLARQNGLPRSIIDFIEQHHGSTLVEYFYRREAKRLEADPDAGELDESTFRYPGPKPQTKETAVLMMADVVESASRALSEPTPARIESLVHDLAMKRLLDGQFDECGLTLHELRTIEDSLVKSLTAVYHGRVRYPEHQTV